MNNSKEKALVLNEDICTEILLRLPVKSVIKLQLVCRLWFSIISTDQFRRLHTLGHRKPQPSLILNPRNSRFLYLNPIIKNPKPLPFSINLPNNPKYVKILSSCNGLLLLKSHGDDNNDDLFVYNPATRQSRKLCLSHSDNNDDLFVRQLYLVFDPTISIHYKIICVRMCKNINTPIEVFDSKSGKWNVCGVPVCGYGYVFKSGSGALHYRNKIYRKTSCNDVYSFELDRFVECNLGTPRLPNRRYVYSNYECLMHVSNECLYYVSLLSDENEGESAALWKLQLRGNYFSPWVLS